MNSDCIAIWTLILTAITAIASCIAAIVSWYTASKDERHLKNIGKAKFDVVAHLRQPYDQMPPAQVDMDLKDCDLPKYYAEQPVILEVDGLLYWAMNANLQKCNPIGLRNYLMQSKFFDIAYVTKQGKKKSKKYKGGGKS